jgi:hypothetical protein
MVIADLSTHDATPDVPCDSVSPRAIVILAAGMVAAWFAAGSTGLLTHSLEHAITWLALAVALLAAKPHQHSFATWAILAIGVIVAIAFTASTIPTVNVFAVAFALAAIAQVSRGITNRVALIAALGAGCLAIWHFAVETIPVVWLLADGIGRFLGRTVGAIVGSPLDVGATFAGLDFLIVMAAILAGWLACTPPPRRSRCLWAVLAIAIIHFAYLTTLAYSEKLLSLLPDMVLPPESDINDVGVWTIGNGLRMLLPWNVPLLAVFLYTIFAAVLYRRSRWLPVIELSEKELKKLKEKEEQEEIPGSVLAADMLFRFGPMLLAIAATLLTALGANRSDLKGKTILAYERGYLNWGKPEYDSTAEGLNGMLPVFVESLGGKFATSKDLAEKDLATADVVVLLHPDEPWPKETLERLWDYVRRGGSLLVVGDPAIREGKSQSSFNDVLQPTSIQVRDDTAVTRTGNWEQSYQVLAHPATAGIDDQRNQFGFELGSSIVTQWPASPVLVGRWGWSDPGSDAVTTGVSHYAAGKQLGDLVLAAEQSFGKGRVFVLGGASPLRNEMLANAYPFVGRLLGYLANRSSSPQAGWRQLLGLLAVLGLASLIALRPAAWQVMTTAAVMSLSLICCTAVGHWSGRVLPEGRERPHDQPNNVAYIDASHLEAFNHDLWTKHGAAGLVRTLMRQGYMPLFATDIMKERLDRAAMLISVAPARTYSAGERYDIKQFVDRGGILVCLVGGEDARSIAPLLADFEFIVPPSPVAPNESIREPAPLGAKYGGFGEGNRQFRFYAAWPVESTDANAQKWSVWTDETGEKAIVMSRTEGQGVVLVIGDTHFASTENTESAETAPPENILFWRWIFSRVLPGLSPWDPPADRADTPSSTDKTSTKP